MLKTKVGHRSLIDVNDRCGGLVHLQVERLIGKKSHQMTHIFIYEERPL